MPGIYRPFFSRDAAESPCIEVQDQKKHCDGVSSPWRQLHGPWHGWGVPFLAEAKEEGRGVR